MSNEQKTQRKIQTAVLLLCGLAVALVVPVAVLSQPDLTADSVIALAVLGVLALAATNFDVTARDGMGVSGNAMVLFASLIVFHEYGFFIGPIIVGCFGAIDVRQVREHAWLKLGFNSSADALSMLGAASVFWLLAPAS